MDGRSNCGTREGASRANVENRWSGRPVSKLLLAKPLALSHDHQMELIEVIPPRHRPGHPMGLEHVGVVVGDDYETSGNHYRGVPRDRQDQGPVDQPLYFTVDDGRTVEFHRHILTGVAVKEGRSFDRFRHAGR